ncbi:hypothetical protein ACMYSQ_001937 [Aspergillus niger]
MTAQGKMEAPSSTQPGPGVSQRGKAASSPWFLGGIKPHSAKLLQVHSRQSGPPIGGQPCKGGFLCWSPRGIPDVIGTCSWLAVQVAQQVLRPHFIPIRYLSVGA